MSTDALLVFCTCPDTACAGRLAERLLEQGLAACVTCGPAVTSVYRWQGRLERSTEVQLLIKSTRTRYPALERTIIELHPYELPEILAVAVERGLAGYLHWIQQCTDQDG